MTRSSALHTAIALFREPTRVKHTRSAELPDDISFLLRLVSRDQEAIEHAVGVSQRPADFVVAAAEFFTEQILLAPSADSYRTLGGSPDVPREKLRWHMVMLLKWLHPDAGCDETRAMLAVRVTRAWNNLKTQERRASYDANRPEVAARALLRHAASVRKTQGPYRSKPGPRLHPRWPDTPRPELDDVASTSVVVPTAPKAGMPGLFSTLLGFFHIKLRRV
jgi:hypothetical protein